MKSGIPIGCSPYQLQPVFYGSLWKMEAVLSLITITKVVTSRPLWTWPLVPPNLVPRSWSHQKAWPVSFLTGPY